MFKLCYLGGKVKEVDNCVWCLYPCDAHGYILFSCIPFLTAMFKLGSLLPGFVVMCLEYGSY